MAQLAMLVFDFWDPAGLEAAKEAAKHFVHLLVLQQQQPLAGSRLHLGVCCLSRPPHAAKVQLQIKQRPAEVSLRELHVALSKVQCGGSAENIDGAQAALALASLLQALAGNGGGDREAAGAAAEGGYSKQVVWLTDCQYEPEELQRAVKSAQEKRIGIDVYLATAGLEAAAGGWGALEAALPNLRVTLVESPGREAFRSLPALLLERYCGPRGVAVNLQFKVPLLGEVRALELSAQPALARLDGGVAHAPICPCHKLPGLRGLGTGCCCMTGEPFGLGTSGGPGARDSCTIQLGAHPGGLLHFASPFNIAVGAGGPAALTVVQRIKREELNPACLLGGAPLVLAPRGALPFKAMHEGELLELTQLQLLQALAERLREAGELLAASSTSSLESGQAGLFKQFWVLAPGGPGALLHAARIATAEELPSPAALLAAAAPAPQLPPPLAEAVRAQLGQVQLGPFNPLAYSSRCHETIEMLVMESKPLPKLLAPLPVARPACALAATAAAGQGPAAAAAATPAPAAQQLLSRAAQPAPSQAPPPEAAPVQPGGGKGGRRGAAKAAAAKPSAAAGKVQQAARGSGLQLKRIQR